MDFISLIFAICGGLSMGTYPVPIKAPSIVDLQINPVIFQWYKSCIVLLTSLLCLIPVYYKGHNYVWTYWAFVSAFAWVPSGLGTIFAVPIIGVGPTVVIGCSTASVLSFLVFWLVIGEEVKEHTISGVKLYFAPIYLGCIVFGMAGLVFSKEIDAYIFSSEPRRILVNTESKLNPELDTFIVQEPRSKVPHIRIRYVYATISAIFVGICSAMQYGALTLGKKYEQRRHNCADSFDDCPKHLKEAFNNGGSFLVSFGISAVLVTFGYILLLIFWRQRQNPKRNFSFHWRALKGPGVLAGTLWSVANFLNFFAVVREGNAIAVPQTQSVQLITSGLWGVVYYREIEGRPLIFWTFFAMWLLVFIVLLGFEKK